MRTRTNLCRAAVALFALLILALPLGSGAVADGDTNAVEQRLRAAVAGSERLEVVYDDVLGEGADRWDPDPRYPDGRVNCIIWIQYLLAEAYGATREAKLAAMDAIRYFGSQVSWGTRIHYVDHWARLAPGPLVPVRDPACVPDQRVTVQLDVPHFKQSHAYSCPIYGEDDAGFAIDFMSRKASKACTRQLPEGLYVGFAVAADRYIELYGASSGRMGRVHGLILDLRGPPGRGEADVEVVHASTSQKRVARDRWSDYVKKMRTIHQGYEFYRLDPEWQPSASPGNVEFQQILACERTLGR